MKKFFTILIIIGLVGLAFYIFSDKENNTPDFKYQNKTDEFKPDPSNGTFIFEDGPVTLSKGRAEKEVGRGLVEEIEITDVTATGDINGDGRDDTAVLIARLGGGSGQFFYVSGFVSAGSSYKGTNALYVGDRISPQSISIENVIITFRYLDRSAEEPLAASPTIPHTKTFVFRSGTIVER